MGRMDIRYDLLTWEGDILRLHFWAHAFEFLKKIGAVFLQTEGKLAGCWVMRIEDEPEAPAEDRRLAADRRPRSEPEEQREKVIVRSDGTVTYVGKDMAYQLWKFGLLGRDFRYRVFARPTTKARSGRRRRSPSRTQSTCPSSVSATMVCNVIDTRQSYLQKLAEAGARGARLSRNRHDSRFILVRDGGAVPRDRARARLRDERRIRQAVRRGVGPKGLGVKADDLLDRLTEKAASEVARRNPEFGPDDVRENGGSDRHGGGALLHGEILARQGHRVRHRRGAQFRGRERTRTCSTPPFAPTTSSAS